MTWRDRAYRQAAARAVARLPGLDGERQAEVAATLAELERERGQGRWRELAGVTGLRVRMLARRDTGDVAVRAWRQGLHRGGCLLALTVAAVAVGAALRSPSPVLLGGAALASAGLYVALGDHRALAAALVAAGGAVAAVGLAPAPSAVPVMTGGAVAMAALAVGATPTRREDAPCPARWLLALAVAGPLVALGGVAEVAVVGVALTGVVPALWLAAGRLDARLAVGGATALTWRLAAVDAHELREAVAGVGDGWAVDPLLVRWTVMAAGVAVAVAVARAAVRRADLA
jgi:hypothetical protein